MAGLVLWFRKPFARFVHSCIGGVSNRIRIFLCKRIFKECGKVSTINRNIYFGNEKDIVIGDYSGIGANCSIPNDIHIGKYVMMGPFLYCITFGHEVSDTSTPMCFQGHVEKTKDSNIVIGDDVWIGANVIISKRRHLVLDLFWLPVPL